MRIDRSKKCRGRAKDEHERFLIAAKLGRYGRALPAGSRSAARPCARSSDTGAETAEIEAADPHGARARETASSKGRFVAVPISVVGLSDTRIRRAAYPIE